VDGSDRAAGNTAVLSPLVLRELRAAVDALQGELLCQAWGFRYTGLLTWVKRGLGLGTWWRVSLPGTLFTHAV